MNSDEPIGSLELDALAEIFNISVGYAASSLSELTGESVALSVPFVHLSSVTRLQSLLSPNGSLDSITCISQEFSGNVDGLAFLMFPENNAFEVIKLMLNTDFDSDELTEFEEDALNEIGNIILNTCFSTLADLLSEQLTCGLPSLSFLPIDELVSNKDKNKKEVLFVQIKMSLEGHNIDSYLAFLLGQHSKESLHDSIKKFLKGILE